MPQKKVDIVLIGKETTKGTVAGTFPLHQPFIGAGLVPTITDHLGRVDASSTFPFVTDQVALGFTAQLALTPDFNVNTCRDLVNMAIKRTAGELPSVSIKHNGSTIGDALYLGCGVSQFGLQYSSGGTPGEEAILACAMQLETMQVQATTGVSAGTPAIGRRFRIDKGTFTINGVAATKLFSFADQITIARSLGRPSGAGAARIYNEDGMEDHEITIRAQFTTAAWRNLVLNETEMAISIVHATGTANETITQTAATARVNTHTLSEDDGTTTEEIVIRPYGVNAVQYAFGSSIGASVLSL